MLFSRAIKALKIIYQKIANKIDRYMFFSDLKRIRKLNKKQIIHVVLLGTPSHGNLGDHAIVEAEKRLIKKIGFPSNKIIEIQTTLFYGNEKRVYDSIGVFSIVVIDGGGNIGSLWKREHSRIISILENANKSKIIMFPETVFYSENDYRDMFLTKDKDIFEKANCLYFLRDKISYDFFEKNLIHTMHFLSPDIVFSLQSKRVSPQNHKKIGFIFRNDLEKASNLINLKNIKTNLEKSGFRFEEYSTVIDHRVRKYKRCYEIHKLFKKIRACDLIITDRLHGMIFAYVNNVKCIAMNNVNKKVEGSYQWIKNNDNYLLVDTLNVDTIKAILKNNLNHPNDMPGFENMLLEIKSWIRD